MPTTSQLLSEFDPKGRVAKTFVNEPISTLHQYILNNTKMESILVRNYLTRPIYEVFEHFDFNDLSHLLKSFLDGTGLRIQSYKLIPYDKEINRENTRCFGEFVITVNRKKDFVSVLTPTQIYEQNKTSNKCVGCGQPTSEKALFTSIVNYCPKCCG